MAERDYLQEYHILIKEADGAIADLAALHGDQLRCKPGCCQCCTIRSVLAIEAAGIRQAISQLAAVVREKIYQQPQHDSCPFLLDSLCVLYARRPLICRTHGLPIAYIDYEQQAIEVSVCPLNFSADYAFEQDELFFIDTFNSRLAELNRRYCLEMGLDEGERIAMTTLRK